MACHAGGTTVRAETAREQLVPIAAQWWLTSVRRCVGVRRAAVAAEHAKALQTHERQHVTAAQKQADLETRVAAVRLRQL
eukprot:COSAG01_NODE_2616_length_7374_cov_8.288031_4_plen_80_part_00